MVGCASEGGGHGTWRFARLQHGERLHHARGVFFGRGGYGCHWLTGCVSGLRGACLTDRAHVWLAPAGCPPHHHPRAWLLQALERFCEALVPLEAAHRGSLAPSTAAAQQLPASSPLLLLPRVLYPQLKAQLGHASLAVRQEHLGLLRWVRARWAGPGVGACSAWLRVRDPWAGPGVGACSAWLRVRARWGRPVLGACSAWRPGV